jgi:hypothetical protein
MGERQLLKSNSRGVLPVLASSSTGASATSTGTGYRIPLAFSRKLPEKRDFIHKKRPATTGLFVL